MMKHVPSSVASVLTANDIQDNGTIEDTEKEYKDTMDSINQLQKEGINTFTDLLHLNFLTIKAIELDRKIGLMKITTEDMKCKIK